MLSRLRNDGYVVNEDRKKISSRVAMERCVQTSTTFDAWVEKAKSDFVLMKEALKRSRLRKKLVKSQKVTH